MPDTAQGGADLRHIAEPLRALAVSLASLNLDPANARRHPEKNLKAIQASLEAFGQRLPLVVQKQGMVVRAGNGRVVAARALGWTHMACVVVDETSVDAVAFAIADNRSGELAEWDDQTLADLLAGLPDGAVTGFDSDDVAELVARLAPEFTQDEVPAPPDEATTQPGDLWILGQHRLLCGDSANAADVDRLMDGAVAQLAHVDPPYNVRVEPRSNNAIAAGLSSFTAPQTHHQKFDVKRDPGKAKGTTKKMRAKDRPLANDFVSDEDFGVMLRAWFGNIARVLNPGGAFYCWGGYANCGNYPPVLKRHKLYFSQAIIWDKMHPVLTRKDFMGAHEWCFHGWKLGAAHRFFGPANVTDLWHVKKIPPNAMEHLTAKPVELAARAIAYSSKPGENVLDLFAGSGSTLIAAEQQGRRAYVMEIDPLYCDLVCDRFQRYTGKPAVRERTGDSPIPMKPREECMR